MSQYSTLFQFWSTVLQVSPCPHLVLKTGNTTFQNFLKKFNFMYYVVCTRLLLNFKMVCTNFQNYFTQQCYHLSIYYLKLGNKKTIQNFQFQLYFYSFYQEVFCILQQKIETKCGSLIKMNLKFISLNNRQD